MQRLLVLSPLPLSASPNSRSHHLVRQLARRFSETVALSRINVSAWSRRKRWGVFFRVQLEEQREGSIRWIAVSPWLNIRHGLGLHLLGLPNPYEPPRSTIRRGLRRALSALGVLTELGIFPSLALTYALRVRGRFDVVIAEGPWEALLAWWLRRTGRARVWMYDDIDFQPGFQPISAMRRRFVAALERFAVRRADLVISVGERLARLRREQGAREVRVIPNGVDVELFATAEPLRAACNERRPTLLYMGYLGAWAGSDLLLASAARVARRISELRVILLGHALPLELAELQDAIARRDLRDVVEFRGEVAYAELPGHLAGADLGLALFRPLELTRYAFPLKVVEYMASGLPVLTTADTEAADLVARADAGQAVPFDAGSVAEACIALLCDPARRRRQAANARELARAYDWEPLMREFYETMVSVQPASPPGDSLGPAGPRSAGPRAQTGSRRS